MPAAAVDVPDLERVPKDPIDPPHGVTQAELDEVVSRVLCKSTLRQIVYPYHGSPSWLWRQWRGTVPQVMWLPALMSMAAPAVAD